MFNQVYFLFLPTHFWTTCFFICFVFCQFLLYFNKWYYDKRAKTREEKRKEARKNDNSARLNTAFTLIVKHGSVGVSVYLCLLFNLSNWWAESWRNLGHSEWFYKWGYGWCLGCWCPDSRWCSAAPPAALVSGRDPPERHTHTHLDHLMQFWHNLRWVLGDMQWDAKWKEWCGCKFA